MTGVPFVSPALKPHQFLAVHQAHAGHDPVRLLGESAQRDEQPTLLPREASPRVAAPLER